MNLREPEEGREGDRYSLEQVLRFKKSGKVMHAFTCKALVPRFSALLQNLSINASSLRGIFARNLYLNTCIQSNLNHKCIKQVKLSLPTRK
jgi:hypothetical protein